jgi:hypothetical protein
LPIINKSALDDDLSWQGISGTFIGIPTALPIMVPLPILRGGFAWSASYSFSPFLLYSHW